MDNSALEIAIARKDDRTITLESMLLRDWEAITQDIVAAIEFGTDWNLELESVEMNDDRNPELTFATSGQAQVFLSFCAERNEFVTA